MSAVTQQHTATETEASLAQSDMELFYRPSDPAEGGGWRPALDFATVATTCVLILLLRMGHPSTPPADSFLARMAGLASAIYLPYILLFAFYTTVVSSISGLYRDNVPSNWLHEQRMTTQSTMMAALLLCGTLYLVGGYNLPRFDLLLMVMASLLVLSVRRAMRRRMFEKRYRTGEETRNILIVGDGELAQSLRSHLESLPQMGFRFKGFISVDPQKQSEGRDSVIGDISNCVALARMLFVDEIFLPTTIESDVVLSVVAEARAMGIEVRIVPELYNGLAWNVPIEYVGQFPTIPLHRRRRRRESLLVKRAIDIIVAFTALLLLSPLFALIGIAVALDSGSPIFYRARRIGRKGKEFACLKFRTMVVDADERRDSVAHLNERKSILFKIANDPRVTRVGAVLRKYSLDELPQLINVLRGEMSLVGPRPPIASEVEMYQLAHLRRLDVVPGMTGLWQIHGRGDPSFERYVSMDIKYIENWSLMLDFRILAQTVGVVFGGTGS